MPDAFARFKDDVIELVARWGGRLVYNRRLEWLLDRSWLEPYAKYVALDRAGRHPATRILDRRFTLIKFAESTRRLPGSTAECGVFRGVASALVCKALEGSYRDGSKHFGFDSFLGLPAPSERDQRAPAIHVWRAGDMQASIEDARGTLADFPFCELIAGWIPACFATSSIAAETFRFVHIDVDLHDPTRDCLEFFYPRMVDGGVLFFDDYGFASCPGARAAVDEFFQSRAERVIELASGQAFVIRE